MKRSRNSWFLAELNPEDTDKQKEKCSSPGFKTYRIVHSDDVVGNALIQMRLDRLVQFKYEDTMMGGKLLKSTDDKISLERYLEAMTERNNAIRAHKFYLVHYDLGKHSFVIRIVPKHALSLPSNKESKPGDVLLIEGDPHQPATSLCGYDSEDCLFMNLMIFRARGIHAVFDKSDNETTTVGRTWLLVQYSCHQNDIVFTIVSLKETVCQEQNSFKDVLAYLSDGDNVYRGIIMCKSKDRTELEYAMIMIKERCLSSTFLKQDIKDVDMKNDGPTGRPLTRPTRSEVRILDLLLPVFEAHSTKLGTFRWEETMMSKIQPVPIDIGKGPSEEDWKYLKAMEAAARDELRMLYKIKISANMSCMKKLNTLSTVVD